MSYCVYKHTAPNGKVYIGITRINPLKRWENGHGYKSNLHFWNAIVKYGWDNFTHEILFDDLSECEAQEIEKTLIAEYQSNKMEYGYNRSAGGEPFFQCKHSESAKKKMSEARKGKGTGASNPMYGKGLCGSDNGMFGKHHSKEWKKKRSEKYSGTGHPRYGTKLTAEEKQRNMLSQPYKKTVLQIDEQGNIVNEFNSVREAARILGVNHTMVSRWCNGKAKPKNSFMWEFRIKGGA